MATAPHTGVLRSSAERFRMHSLAVLQDPIVLEDVHRSVAPLTEHLRIELTPRDREGWVDRTALLDTATGPFADLHARFVAAGFGCNRKAAAASLLLRYGWAAGFQIAAWLDRGLVLHLDSFALKFSPSTLVEALWVQGVRIEKTHHEADGYARVLESLKAFTEPLVQSQHEWSRFSRHALWSMAVSSWAAQFASIGTRLGRRDKAVRDARRVFALDPEIARAAPEAYVVRAKNKSLVCQKRSACCLYYKGPSKHFCASCPIISKDERLARNREFVAAS